MKSNTNELRKSIRQLIEKHCPNTNYKKVSLPILYPYVTFEITVLAISDGQHKCDLEINVVSKDVKEVERISDALVDALDHESIINTKVACDIYALKRDSVEEADKEIERRRLLFELNYYKAED